MIYDMREDLLTSSIFAGCLVSPYLIKEKKKKLASGLQYNLKLNSKENYKLENNLTPLDVK